MYVRVMKKIAMKAIPPLSRNAKSLKNVAKIMNILL